LVCLLLFPGTGWGQTGASTIRGSVKDQSGALVSGATVTLTNLETNAVRTAETTTSGAFAFELVPVGDYEVRIEAKGFRKSIVRPVQALVANVTDVPVTLEIGELSSTVTVEAAEATVQVNTQDATLGNNFVAQQITQLPMESRNVLSLLTLQAQVTPDGYVAGGRSDQSNVTLDGVDIKCRSHRRVSGSYGGIQRRRRAVVRGANQSCDEERHEFVAWIGVRIPP